MFPPREFRPFRRAIRGLAIAIAMSLGAASADSVLPADELPEPLALPPWLARFADPPATDRPQMFWVWNGDVNRARTTEVLEQYAQRGIGGVFVHPRPGLITEYLSRDFFDQWKWTLQECKRLGLECHQHQDFFLAGEKSAPDKLSAIRESQQQLLADLHAA